MVLSRPTLLLALSLLPGLAAAQETTFVQGAITYVDQGFTVTDAAGTVTGLRLMPGLKVTELAPRDASEIVAGGLVCAASTVAPDGPVMALEVQIFTHRVRDPAHPPCGALGGSVTVAGRIERVADEGGNLVVDVATGDGTMSVVVAPGTPVVTYEVAGLTLLVKSTGAPVLAFGTPMQDGSLMTDRITVGVDGAVPAW